MAKCSESDHLAPNLVQDGREHPVGRESCARRRLGGAPRGPRPSRCCRRAGIDPPKRLTKVSRRSASSARTWRQSIEHNRASPEQRRRAVSRHIEEPLLNCASVPSARSRKTLARHGRISVGSPAGSDRCGGHREMLPLHPPCTNPAPASASGSDYWCRDRAGCPQRIGNRRSIRTRTLSGRASPIAEPGMRRRLDRAENSSRNSSLTGFTDDRVSPK